MTLALASALTQIATLGMNIYKPQFAPLIVGQKQELLHCLFRKVFTITGVCILALTLFSWLFLHHPWLHLVKARFLPSPIFEIFLLANILFTLSLPWATFMRSYKEEPLLYLSVGVAFLTAVMNIYLGFTSTLMAMGISYLLINVFNLVSTYKIWNRFAIAKKIF
jgi:hypothetical protein